MKKKQDFTAVKVMEATAITGSGYFPLLMMEDREDIINTKGDE